MTYALLVYDRDDSLARLSEQERAVIYAEYEQFARTDGLTGYRLQPPDRATTLRIRSDSEELLSGPVANAVPPLAGF